jgi:hypothetical protein
LAEMCVIFHLIGIPPPPSKVFTQVLIENHSLRSANSHGTSRYSPSPNWLSVSCTG